jgi:hypothetical protein
VRPARKRELVNGGRSKWGVSIRRACRVLEMGTATFHYKSRRREQARIEARIREICETRVRYCQQHGKSPRKWALPQSRCRPRKQTLNLADS